MFRSQRNSTAWLLVALFLLSASHGVLFHSDHDHSVSDCALCVLVWTMAITAATVIAVMAATSQLRSRVRRHDVSTRALVHTSGQRAPPVPFLLSNPS